MVVTVVYYQGYLIDGGDSGVLPSDAGCLPGIPD